MDDRRRDDDNANSVLRTWKLSFDQISKQKPRAAELLFLTAVMDRQNIPRSLLQVPEFVTAIATLQAFSLVSNRTETNSYHMHRLVQRFILVSLEHSGTLTSWQETALTSVAKAWPSEIGMAQWAICDSLTPHAQVVLEYPADSRDVLLHKAYLCCWTADYDIERGWYDRSLDRATTAVELYQKLLPKDDERLISALLVLGRFQFNQATSEGDFEAASATLEKALHRAPKPSILHAEIAFELADLYYEQNKVDRSLSMSKIAWQDQREILGPSHVRTLDVAEDYALKLAFFGFSDQAISVWQEVPDQSKSSNVSENTKLVFTLRSSAGISEHCGDYGMAEDFYRNIVTVAEKIYGPSNLHALDYRISLAEQIMRGGRPAEALHVTRAVLEECEKDFESE